MPFLFGLLQASSLGRLCAHDFLLLQLRQPLAAAVNVAAQQDLACPPGKPLHLPLDGAPPDHKGFREIRELFLSRCVPSCEAVFGCLPELGQPLSTVADAVPLRLGQRLAAGSLADKHGAPRHLEFRLRVATARALGLPAPFDVSGIRSDLEDPTWIGELCKTRRFHELFRYRLVRPGHINVNEARVLKPWLKALAKGPPNVRVAALLDSRVTIGAAAKSRSSSFAICRALQGCLG